MNVVDSCGWLEYFADGTNADFFAHPLSDAGAMIVPAVCLYEVYRRMAAQAGEEAALRATAQMRESPVIDVTASRALSAARVSLESGLPMADSLILAIAREYDAELWTQDADFAHIPGVRYVAKGTTR